MRLGKYFFEGFLNLIELVKAKHHHNSEVSIRNKIGQARRDPTIFLIVSMV
jgi:hypothetical protein